MMNDFDILILPEKLKINKLEIRIERYYLV